MPVGKKQLRYIVIKYNPEGKDNFLIFYPTGKAGGAQVIRCQGIAVNYYGFTLGALALSPSGFCNAGVYCENLSRNIVKNK